MMFHPLPTGAARCMRRSSSIGMWQRIRWPGSGSESGGSCCSQMSPIFLGHRVWKTQPDGGDTALGISPSRRMRVRSPSPNVGTADSSDSV